MASTPKVNLPNLQNATPEGLIDIIGDLREQQKDLKQREGVYTEALKGRFPEERKAGIKGEKWEMVVLPVTQERLDTEAVKDLLDRLHESKKITDEEFAECFKTASFEQMKFKAVGGK
jgi:hypothetical protein